MKLEIEGFKSFMTRLELDFSSGITAIVGPNGCGKTNIVDAMRWVLGEQKTRLLRNTKMENVIFNGTKTRKPLGMAEVRVTLSNEDHSLPLDYGEVTISRRLFRDGASEYCINGETSRLKDIRSLLYDTGLGNHAYSIIEREMIDAVVSDKNQDKKALFEEAAGIMRYRSQREEALRKIKLTENDILRLEDIINELDKEVRSLRYQRSRARRFLRIREKVSAMEGTVLKRRLLDYLVEYDRLDERRKIQEEAALLEESELSKRESELEEMRLEAARLEHGLKDLHERRYGLGEKIQRMEEGIAVANERVRGIEARIAENSEEIARTRRRITDLGADTEALQRERGGRQEELARLRETMAELAETLQRTEAELERLKQDLSRKKRFLLAISGGGGMREHLEATLREAEEKRERLLEKDSSLRERGDRVQAELAGLNRALDEASRSKYSCTEDIELLSKRRSGLRRMLEECSSRSGQIAVDVGRLEEKRRLLAAVASKHRERSEEETARSNGFLGYLADFIRVPAEYRRCFEACLAPVLENLVARSREDAFSGVRRLKESGNGGYRVLYPAGWGSSYATPGERGIIGPAIDFVECSSEVEEHLSSYLAGVVVVDDIDKALQIVEDSPESRVATLDGVFFDGPGRVIVSPATSADVSLLEYETKLREMEEESLRLSSARDREVARAKALQSDLAELEEEEGRARRALSSWEDSLRELRKKIGEAEIEGARIAEARAGLEEQIEELTETMKDAKLALAESARSDGEEGAERDARELAELERKIEELTLRREETRDELSRIKLEETRCSGVLVNLESRLKNAGKLIDELEKLVSSKEQENSEGSKKIEENRCRIDSIKVEIAILHREKESVEGEITELSGSSEGLLRACKVLEGELKEIKKRREEKREELQRLSASLAAQETRISSLLDTAREKLGEDFSRFVEKRELLDSEQLEDVDGEEFDNLRRELERFGPVNMLALEDYEEKKKRYDFLVQQKKDLEESRDSLVQAIRKINREARVMLSETFEKIRMNFKATFLSLFDGGEADLYFVDSDDPLEANIRIVANPKGKRLHDISSLSGGERALVALSLLFAIYLVKPSPFCVFDEVDAPLDDANVARFVRMLHSFTDRTQFIVITHNKRTMEAADCLYGVTMEEPGVSKMISVRISDVDGLHSRRAKSTGSDAAVDEVTVQA